MAALRLSRDDLISAFRFDICNFDEYLAGSCLLTPMQEHEVRAQLEYKGAYFSLDPQSQESVRIAHPNMKFFLPKDSLEQAENYATDARIFLFSADALCRRQGLAWEYYGLDLPVILLLTHAIELSLKSYILERLGKTQNNHNLLDLYDLCRKLGCEDYVEMSDENYWKLYRLSKITIKAYHKYREVDGQELFEYRHVVFPIAEKIIRLARPPFRAPSGPAGGHIRLVASFPASLPTPPKRPLS